MNLQKIAVPSEAPGGLTAKASAHFGHCAAYTVANVENGEIVDVVVIANEGHEHGNCLAPVQVLADMGVQALIAGGMGMRPLNAMRQAGIKVYFSNGINEVGSLITAFAEGKLAPFGDDRLCKGCGGHH